MDALRPGHAAYQQCGGRAFERNYLDSARACAFTVCRRRPQGTCHLMERQDGDLVIAGSDGRVDCVVAKRVAGSLAQRVLQNAAPELDRDLAVLAASRLASCRMQRLMLAYGLACRDPQRWWLMFEKRKSPKPDDCAFVVATMRLGQMPECADRCKALPAKAQHADQSGLVRCTLNTARPPLPKDIIRIQVDPASLCGLRMRVSGLCMRVPGALRPGCIERGAGGVVSCIPTRGKAVTWSSSSLCHATASNASAPCAGQKWATLLHLSLRRAIGCVGKPNRGGLTIVPSNALTYTVYNTFFGIQHNGKGATSMLARASACSCGVRTQASPPVS